MSFHSPQFWLFFIPVFLVFWKLPLFWQNRWLLAASYYFYYLNDKRFLGILLLSTVFTYFAGNKIAKKASVPSTQRWLLAAVFFHCALLLTFKYSLNPSFIPMLGISFFTFKALSYCADIYRGEIETARFTDLALYLSFFPQILAGPIDRSKPFLAQLKSHKAWDWTACYAACYLFSLGYFQKIFVADNIARLIAPVFSAPHTGPDAWLAMYGYAIQLYCDFCGYSLMAWGTAKLLGFETTHNFDAPFFSPNIQQFWNRWHISLSIWVRDYIYTPIFIAISKTPGMTRICITTLISMIAIGLWHGGAWHYAVYGLYHGVLLCLYFIFRPIFQKIPSKGLGSVLKILFTFHLVAFGFLIFRSSSMPVFTEFAASLLNPGAFSASLVLDLAYYCVPFFILETAQFSAKNRWAAFDWPVPVRAVIYIACFILLALNGAPGAKDFIYFQF